MRLLIVCFVMAHPKIMVGSTLIFMLNPWPGIYLTREEWWTSVADLSSASVVFLAMYGLALLGKSLGHFFATRAVHHFRNASLLR